MLESIIEITSKLLVSFRKNRSAEISTQTVKVSAEEWVRTCYEPLSKLFDQSSKELQAVKYCYENFANGRLSRLKWQKSLSLILKKLKII